MAQAALTTTTNFRTLTSSGPAVAENRVAQAAAWRRDAFGGVAVLPPSNKRFLTRDGVAR
jgi:hypothetical protein